MQHSPNAALLPPPPGASLGAMATISELWRYPVKSVGGERVSSVAVTELGMTGDRGWGIFDTETSTVLTARRTPELLFASASVVDEDADQIEITLPDGSLVRAGAGADEALSSWLGRAVELRRAGEEGGTYEVPLDFENDADWVSWQGPGGAWHDSTVSRVSLVSRPTLRDWDQRRFRTNVILDRADDEPSEDELISKSIKIGSTQLHVMKQIDRCVIVTRPQPEIERDLDVLRVINKERAALLSIGALVEAEGIMSEGDEVAVV